MLFLIIVCFRLYRFNISQDIWETKAIFVLGNISQPYRIDGLQESAEYKIRVVVVEKDEVGLSMARNMNYHQNFNPNGDQFVRMKRNQCTQPSKDKISISF